jgi:hypothetical protein
MMLATWDLVFRQMGQRRRDSATYDPLFFVIVWRVLSRFGVGGWGIMEAWKRGSVSSELVNCAPSGSTAPGTGQR